MRRLAAILALIAAPLAGVADDKPKEPSEKVAKFLGAYSVRMLKEATKVACYRIKPEVDKSASPVAVALVDGHQVTATGKERDAEFGAKLREVLFDENTYDFDKAKRCEFEPGVAFVLSKEKEHVDVLLCFHCNELEVISFDPKAPEAKVSHEDFDAARAALVKLAKEAFPDDKEVQGLKEKEDEKK